MAASGGLFGIFLAVFAISLLQSASGISTSGGISRGAAIGPGFFPQLYLWAIGTVGFLLIVTERGWREAWQQVCWRPIAIGTSVMALLLLYWVELLYTGYVAATFLFQTALFGIAFGHRSFVWLVLVPIVMTAGALILLQVLGVSLPRGSGMLYEINRKLF